MGTRGSSVLYSTGKIDNRLCSIARIIYNFLCLTWCYDLPFSTPPLSGLGWASYLLALGECES
jgi:hypothetical protein